MFSRNIGRLCFIVFMIVSCVIPTDYRWMILNMILAFIPFELSFLFPLFKPQAKREWPLFIIFILVFIFFVPNVFYVITDLIHLNLYAFDFMKEINIYEWLNFTYLLMGVYIALYFYVQILINIKKVFSKKWSYIGCGLVIIMTSLGIYIGRFLRFHTVHLLTKPWEVAKDTIQALDMEGLLWIGMMSLLQCLLLLLVKGVRNR